VGEGSILYRCLLHLLCIDVRGSQSLEELDGARSDILCNVSIVCLVDRRKLVVTVVSSHAFCVVSVSQLMAMVLLTSEVQWP
jgi:hypothetical protein